MMKNTLTITREELVSNYADAMTEFLNTSRDVLDTIEFAEELVGFGTDLIHLSSKDLKVVRATLEWLFQEGQIKMMLPAGALETLKQWYSVDKHFQVAVFSREGEPIGLFDEEVVRW